MATYLNKIIDSNEKYQHFGLIPVSDSAGKTSNYYSLKNYRHAKIVIASGSSITGSSAVLIKRAKTVAAGSAEDWIKWDTVYVNANVAAYNGEDASETKDLTKTAVTSYTKTLATANTMWVIEFDAIELDYDGGGFDCFGVVFAAGLTSTVITVYVELSEARFKAATPPDGRTN